MKYSALLGFGPPCRLFTLPVGFLAFPVEQDGKKEYRTSKKVNRAGKNVTGTLKKQQGRLKV
ncbi:hypothetical protein FH5T_00225 [Draconibacterium orientale]|uniref:Uncharacterized protein n=1 Tax=Draconibacterium orientale TaxID=1168034 RepID=A0ABM5QD61_9BACT|nr:hypothetical protein FH5T_00225 [Draconibacterium orientale]